MIPISNEKELRSFIQDQLLFTSEAAELLECSRQAISLAVKNGTLEPVKDTGKERLFLRSDIIAYKERRSRK
ncbi:helix-turn-helix domain-containing protein [Bacillales bacterium AN1005]|uniref:helix-turn-helix domain-containing protein n=1 Tax=Niallia taxi TaxID=2499688 RepID=UPI0021A4AF2D|nr:helix-turn-helix domain-containing protein [Niallia taxi]MCT2347193.1 helix-turn-helix domain-containing protein [Niallia taxi]